MGARSAILIGLLMCTAVAPPRLRAAPPDAGEPADDLPEDEAAETQEEEVDYLALADAPLFLPRSYLYWGTPVGRKDDRKDLVFALEYALHLPIYSNARDQALHGRPWAFAVTLSFEGDLRMFAEESKPVRMPSYRPNLSGQVFYLWHRAQPVLFGLRTGLYHYSNGQEQCTFDRSVTDESVACQQKTDMVRDAALELNRYNGNFSSNGWLLAAHARIHQVNSKGVAVAHLAAGFTVTGLIQGGGALAMEPALKRLYGWGRLQWDLELKKRLGWALVTARGQASYYPSAGPDMPRVAGSVEGVIGPYWLTGLGFFARYYGGRDFYNAFFVDRIQQFAAGLAWDGERPFKFKRD